MGIYQRVFVLFFLLFLSFAIVLASSTVASTTIVSPTTTDVPTTTVAPTTTDVPTTTVSPTTTDVPTATVAPTTIDAPTSTIATTSTTTPGTTTPPTFSPEIANQPIDVNLLESTPIQTQLACITCTDPDGSNTKVKIISVTPSTTNGTDSSFTSWKETGATDYCVYYIPGQGRLSYNVAPIITLQLQCSDDLDPPTTANMEVRLQPNYPPEFPQSVVTVNVPSSKDKTKVDALYQVIATDVTLDDVLTYSMTSSPDLGYLEIDPATGEIKPSQDFSTLCGPTSSQLDVMVTDSFNNPVGPMKITLNLDDTNRPPALTNMNREILVGEHAFAEKKATLFTVQHDDDFILKDQLQYTMVVMPTDYEAYFKMDGNDLTLLTDLNYEVQQSFNITLFPTDGYCPGSPSWISIQVTDQNDPVTLTFAEPLGYVDEGLVTFDPSPQIKDEDRLDNVVYSIVGKNTKFTINPTTGVISSIGEYDMDGTKNTGIENLLIRATDTGGNFSEAAVMLNIDEINDNNPTVTDKSYLAESMTCSDPTNLGIKIVTPSDADRKGSVNEEVSFIPQSSGPLLVTKNGDVFLTSAPQAGFYSVNVFAVDHGVKPGPLTSAKSVTVNLVVTPCTTTPPTTTTTKKVVVKAPASTVVQNTVQKTATATSTSSDFNLDYLWIALGSLLGLLLLGLLAYLLYRCCCANGCRGANKTVKPASPKNKVHPTKEVDAFWKDHYVEEDILVESNRLAISSSQMPDIELSTLQSSMGARY